jgi:hypothetical protein
MARERVREAAAFSITIALSPVCASVNGGGAFGFSLAQVAS